MNDDLTFESTTDTPEQMRDGLGLPPEPVTSPVVAADTHVAEDSPAVPAADPVAAAPVEAAQETTTIPAIASTVGRARGADGKFIAAAKPADPVADALAAAKAEAETLKAKVAELEKPKAAPEAKPAPPVQPVSAPEPPSFDVDAYRDPAITAKFEKLREALGAEPQQLDDDDYTVYQSKLRAYDRQLAVLNAKEENAHERAAEQAVAAERQARSDVQRQFATFHERKLAAKARHADYDAVMERGNSIPFTGPHREAIHAAIVNSEVGGELIYRLAQEPDEVARILALPDTASVLRAVGRWEERVSATGTSASAPSGATQTGPSSIVSTAPVRPVSKAPEPQGTMLGGGSTVTVSTPETAKDYQEYKRVRAAQIRAKLGR